MFGQSIVPALIPTTNWLERLVSKAFSKAKGWQLEAGGRRNSGRILRAAVSYPVTLQFAPSPAMAVLEASRQQTVNGHLVAVSYVYLPVCNCRNNELYRTTCGITRPGLGAVIQFDVEIGGIVRS